MAALAVISVVAAAAVVALPSNGATVLMCPEASSDREFHDTRHFCATRATALARIDGGGRVSYFVEPSAMPCRPPHYMVVNENTTSVMGHGPIRCDIDDTGRVAYVFPHCSLTMNYPGNEDYRPALPIGLLVEPYDC